MKRIYLDNAATTAIHPEVQEVMIRALQEDFGNPSSIHAEGRKVRAHIEAARKTVARYLNASIGEIFFTSGGTESNNTALKCAVRDLGIKRIISSSIEHHCVLHTLEHLHNNYGTEIVFLDVDHRGRLDLNHLSALLQVSDSKTLVSIMHANNEIGTLNDIEQIAEICKEFDALFHSDTVQTIGHFPIDLQKTPVHFISGAAHKFEGPKGVGFLYINNACQIKPFIDGGSQERNMRGGTENVYGILGLAKALSITYDNRETHQAHIESLRKYLMQSILDNFENVQINGDYDGKYLYTVLNVSFPPSDKSELLLFNLDIAGISVSGGSACSSGADKGSHVIDAIGVAADRKNIRFSFSHHNTMEEMDFVMEKLKAIIPALAHA
ncbi:MAG: cysteine desulfurase family protein [Saprospiraceae bacterium]